ncbi:MAG: FAD:protein transferase [Actinomycetota bacterium]|jgi:thiamine biosynthesis lipoprotein|nr:FAD:protein transferase [Actinomycetota bacterium]
MPASLLLRATTLDDVDGAVAAMYDELRRVDALFSTYSEDSDVSRIRRDELTVAAADPLVQEVLALCEDAKTATDGWFDIDLPGGLDPSGLVKGWAIERAMGVLSKLQGIDVCLNVGGDVAVRSAGEPFVVGIEDPHNRSRVLAAVPVSAGGLATSGTSARGLHILDPHNGRPADALASVSVVGPSLLWADVYATAAFARGHGALAWLATVPSYDGLVVHHDGRLESTDGWL